MLHGHHDWIQMWPFPIILLIILIIGLYLIFRPRYPMNNTREETALDLLKKRYAKGEINKEEYEQIKKDISKN